MAITRDQFLAATAGQHLVDHEGLLRKVLENRSVDSPRPCLLVESTIFGEERVYWTEDEGICDDDFGLPIFGLNHPDARIAA